MMRVGLGLGVTNREGGEASPFPVSIGSGSVTTGTLLTATVSNLVGGETVTYQWTDDGVNIAGATAQTYTPTIGVDGVADADGAVGRHALVGFEGARSGRSEER